MAEPDVAASGSIAASTDSVAIDLQGRQSAAVLLGGTFSATVIVDTTVDGTTWMQADLFDEAARARATSTTATGSFWILNIAGKKQLRVRPSLYTSGTVSVKIRGSDAAPYFTAADVTSSAPGSSAFGEVVRVAGTVTTSSGTGSAATHVQGTQASSSALVGNPLAVAGSDGSLARIIKTDSGGAVQVDIEVGSTVAVTQGASASAPWSMNITDASGVNRATVTSSNALKVDGSAVTQPVSGSVTVTQASSASVPFSVTLTNPSGAQLNAVTVQGSGSFTVAGTVTQGASTSLSWPVMLSNGSGAQQGTAAAPLRIDPTGSTTQPVSGTVTANQGGSWSAIVTQASSASVPFSVTLTNPSGAQINAVPVQASGSFPVTGTFWQATQPVSGTVTANQGGAPWSVSQAASASLPWPITKTGPSGTAQPDDWRTITNYTAVEASPSASALFASTPAKTVGGCFSPWTATVYYGGSGVTSANGMPLAASQSVCFDAFNLAGWYVVTASGTTSVRVQSFQSAL